MNRRQLLVSSLAATAAASAAMCIPVAAAPLVEAEIRCLQCMIFLRHDAAGKPYQVVGLKVWYDNGDVREITERNAMKATSRRYFDARRFSRGEA